ncbi:tetratricopeptide repeat protein [Magnetococcus sp. PR-3]|uniref:tetratricopeptide repeat protein n=1 Tax=Magnetococcus sp. PR-3 TaxID=3120355 RepID=UPI002FCE219A
MKRFLLLLVVLLGLSGCATVDGPSGSQMASFEDAVKQFKAEHYEQAHKTVLALMRHEPYQAKYWGLRGWTHLKRGEMKQSKRWFQKMLQLDDRSMGGHQGMGWWYLTKGNMRQAKAAFKRQRAQGLYWRNGVHWYGTIKADGKKYITSIISDADYGLGSVYLAEKKWDRAQKHLQEALQRENDFSGHGPILETLGDAVSARQEYTLASQIYRQSLQIKPSAKVRAKLAWLLLYQRQLPEATRQFSRIAKKSKKALSARYGLFLAASKLGKQQLAQKAAMELIKQSPAYTTPDWMVKEAGTGGDFTYLWQAFAQSSFKAGYFYLAERYLTQLVENGYGRCGNQSALAWSQMYLGKFDRATQGFQTLINSSNCDRADALLGTGLVRLYQDKLTEADRYFTNALSIDPDRLRAQLARGAVAYLKKDYRRAIGIYQSRIGQVPTDETFFSWGSHAYNNYGWSLLRLGHYRHALGVFQRLKQLYPNRTDGRVELGLGWSYLRLGYKRPAQREFMKVLQWFPDSIAARKGLQKI